MAEAPRKDFFISYTGVDRAWAEWIAWQLEADGYTTLIQAWDFRPGGNFALDMHQAVAESERTIAVLSQAYLSSGFTAAEWAAAFARDPTGAQGLLVPVRIEDCEPLGLLPQIVYIDLQGLETEAAKNALLTGVRRQRAKPSREPRLPGHSSIQVQPLFPGLTPALSEDQVSSLKLVKNLLRELLDSQFERLLSDLDPEGLVRSSSFVIKPAEDRALRADEFIQLMIQQGPHSVDSLQQAILEVRSPFSPFNGKTLENWIGYPQDCWQVSNSQIFGVGSDPLTFLDSDTPLDLQYASLLIWEGLAFSHGAMTTKVWIPLLGRGGAGGLVLRHIQDQSALIGLLRAAQPDHPRLELWHRTGARLSLLQSMAYPLAISQVDSYQLTLKTKEGNVYFSVNSDFHPNDPPISINISLPLDHRYGHAGFIKFNNDTISFTDIFFNIKNYK